MSDDTIPPGRALQVVGLLVLVSIVAPFVVTGAPELVGASESYVVLSGSMAAEPEPVIDPGDVLIVQDVAPSDVETGDVITYETNRDQPTTHRVVEVQRQNGSLAFVTKGDNNEEPDPQPVAAEDVLGRLWFVLPLVGHVVTFANTTAGLVVLVGLPIGLLVVTEAWTLVSDAPAPPTSAETEVKTAEDVTEVTEAELEVTEDETEAADVEDDPASITLHPDHLGWLSVGGFGLSVGVGIVAFRLETAWALTLFYAVLGTSAVAGLLSLRARGVFDRLGDEAETDGPAFVTGSVAEDVGADRVVVDADELDAVVEMAREHGVPVVHDETAGTYVVVTDQSVFRHSVSTANDGGAAPRADGGES